MEMDLKKITHEWNVDKIIRAANIQYFRESGHWRRGPEPHFAATEKMIEALLAAVLEQDEQIKVNARQSELLLRRVNELSNALMRATIEDGRLVLLGL